MNGRLWSALRACVIAALVFQLAFPPAPLRAQALGSSATLTVSPTVAFVGDTITLSGTVTSRLAGTTFALDFGDGQSTPIATPATLGVASPFSFTHVYGGTAQSATAVVRIIAPTGTSAGARAVVALAVGGIVGPAGTVTMGLPANFTVTANSTVFPPGAFSIVWGDGSAPTSAPVVASQSVPHTYANAGTYTVSLMSPAGAKVAGTQVSVAPLNLTIAAAPNPLQAGQTDSLTFLGGTAGGSGTVNVAFGDGQTTTFPYAARTVLSHVFARPGTYTVTASVGTTQLASLSVSAVTSSLALTTSPNPSLAGSPVTINTTAIVPAGASPPPILTLDYGDGTPTTGIGFSTGTYVHAYAARGTFLIKATDPTTGTQYATATQTVLAPGATVMASNGVVAQPVSITIGVTALGALNGPNLIVNFGDGTAAQTIPYAATTLTHAYATAGTYTITVSPLGANAGPGAPFATTTTTVTAPMLTLSAAPNPSLAGSSVTLSVATTAVFANAPPPVTINFGDGSATQTIPFAATTLAHTYAAAGTFTVTATTANGAQLATLTQRVVTPSATLSVAPNPVAAGAPATITLGVGSLAGLPGPNLTINFGDGSPTQTVPYAATTVQHTYATGGVFTVSATAAGGAAPLATTSATVNAPSNVSLASSPNPAFAGSAVSIAVTAQGVGNLVIAFGDGQSQTIPFANATLSHTYAAAGSYAITATSAAGGPALFTLAQSVVTPTATLTASPNPGLQGSPVSFALGVGSIGNAPPPSLTINYGDGSAPQTVAYANATLTHTYASAGQFTVVVTTAGSAAPLATAPITILTPMVSLAATPNPQFAGQPMSVALTVNSIPIGVAPTLTIRYGDGSAPVTVPFGAATLTHTYAVAGQFTITVGSSQIDRPLFTLPVRIVSPSATLAATPNPVLANANVSFALGVGSLFGLVGPNLTVNYGDGSAPQSVPYANATLTHAYRTAGTYPVSIVAAGSTTLLASTQVTVMAPMATLAIAPNPQLAGAPVSIALTVTSLAVNAPNLTIDFGDGSAAQTIPYGSTTLAHTYANTGTFTVRATDPTGAVNASASVQIVAPSATLMVAPNPVMLGHATGVTVMVGNIGTLPAPSPLTVSFGDGSTQQIAYATATIQHTYTAVGTYQIQVSGPTLGTNAKGALAKSSAIAIFATTTVTVVQQTQNLTVMTPAVTTGSPAQIMVTLTPPGGFSANPVLLLFGDGTSTTVRATGLYPHAYGAPGIYTVTLASLTSGATLATSQLTVNGIAPRVPIGAVYGTTFTLSPVLAGDQTQVIVQFSIAVPTLANVADPIEAYIDLTTTKGKLIRRTDLFEISPANYSGPGVKTVNIPFDTPLDAAGTYLVKVTLISAQGGTIVTGPPATLIIIGGPDPLPKIETDLHSSGAVEIGPHAGEPGITFDPSISNAVIFPTYAVGITGLFDPVSHRSDPVFALKSGAQQVVRGPDATPPPANGSPAPSVGATVPAAPLPTPPGPLAGGRISGSTTYLGSLDNVTSPSPASSTTPTPAPQAIGATPLPVASESASPVTPAVVPPLPDTQATPGPPPPSPSHPYQGVYGRGQATLPGLLGGGTTLRGLDIVDSAGEGPTTYQVGYGYTTLGTATTSAQRGAIADIARSFDGNGIARVAFFGRQDDPVTYATTPTGTGPLVADAEVFEFTSPTLGPLTFTATGALSEAHSLSQAYRVDDASDKFTLAFQKPTYNFTFDYHNAGGLFAVGAGPSATSDRVGFASGSTIQLWTVASLALGYTKDETRSAFSRQSDAFATMNFTLPGAQSLQVGVRRDTQRTPTSDTQNDSGTFNLGGHLGIATIALNGSLSATRDYIDAINGTTTRTLGAQFAVQQNAHALGIGINATTLSGASPNATVGESLTYGFPFLGHIVNGALLHGVELQLSATNTASHSPGSGTADEALAAILSYHLNQHLALGVRNEYTWHQDAAKIGNTKASALRLRLDLTQ